MSDVRPVNIGMLSIMVWTWASIRPGMSVLPPPSIKAVSARRSVGMGSVEIFSILLPRIRTCEGADKLVGLPVEDADVGEDRDGSTGGAVTCRVLRVGENDDAEDTAGENQR